MELYEKLGFKSKNELKDVFFDSLLMSNYTYDFFADWDKIFENVYKFEDEINILNGLCYVPKEKLEDEFRNILENNPNVVEFIPSLLAIREKEFELLDIETVDFKKLLFSRNNLDMESIFLFSKKSGLIDLFYHIFDLKSYIMGLELGLDTHSRKNRSGNAYKDFLENFLKMKLSNKPGFRLHVKTKLTPSLSTVFDFIISKQGKPSIIIQCNFYNKPGSKTKQLAANYIDMQKQLKDYGIHFIWAIDGDGWKKMKSVVDQAFEDLDLVLNYKILDSKFDDLLNL